MESMVGSKSFASLRLRPIQAKNWRGAGPCGWARFQFLPLRTAREVFPQAAHPMKFSGRVMCRLGHGGHFHSYAVAKGKWWIFQAARPMMDKSVSKSVIQLYAV